MKLQLNAPSDLVGSVLSDLTSRRAATVSEVDALAGGFQSVTAEAPLTHMVGYSSLLKSLTKGQGTFSMELAEYGPLDSMAYNKLVDEMGGVIPHDI